MSTHAYIFVYRVRPARCRNRECGRIFEKKSPTHDYCSEECRRAATYGKRVCKNPACPKVFIPTATRGRLTDYCSRDCYLKCVRKEN